MVHCIKNRKLSIFLLIILLFIPIVDAAKPVVRGADLYKAPEGINPDSDLFSRLSVQAELYNQKFDKVPMLFQRLVGSEQIAVIIKLDNGEMLYLTFLMTGGKVLDFYRHDTPDDPYAKFEPTMEVETNEQTVVQILDSSNPLREAVKCMNEGSYKVVTKGFFRSAILWTIKEIYS
jgi:hypothetical protein